MKIRGLRLVNLVKQDDGEACSHLKPLAIKLLSGIESAGNIERAHKQYGLVQGSKRKRLGPNKADKLTYIQANKMYMAVSKAAHDWAITNMEGDSAEQED